jgi:hypothetical protein
MQSTFWGVVTIVIGAALSIIMIPSVFRFMLGA